MKRVVVAGATGYLGAHLVTQLVRRGVEVRAIVRPGKMHKDATEVVEAQVTEEGGLDGVCEGADAVFSALGITRQTDNVTYEDVEYTANLRLLAEAQRAGVCQFGVISVVAPESFLDLAILASRERFVKQLQQAELESTVVRATGFFCDMQEVMDMAASGRVWLIGNGNNRVNPIHGADLANACIDAMEAGEKQVNVGGPDELTWNEVAAMAFEVLGKVPKVHRVPAWFPELLLPLVRVFHQRAYDVGSFITRGATLNLTAPPYGEHHLRGLFEELANEHSS